LRIAKLFSSTFFCARSIAFEQLPAHAVHGLTLLVHHVVVFEDVLARSEMLGFDGLLRSRDAFRNQPRFDGHVLFHAEAQHQILHALAAEDAEQIVL
jgi:hypothetical protein